MKKIYTFLCLLSLLFSATAFAVDTSITILIKENINASGSTPLFISIYDSPKFGRLLYETKKTVTVSDNQFVEALEVPLVLLRGYSSVYVEFSKVNFPRKSLYPERMVFTVPPDQQIPPTNKIIAESTATLQVAPVPDNGQVLAGESVCYTCGGYYPYQAGALATRSGGPNIERGRGCSGSLKTTTTDSRPFLCYATCLQRPVCRIG